MAQKRCQEPIAERPGGCCALTVPDTFSEAERPKTLVVGIGSAHGDDQAGWMMAQAVAEAFATDDGVSVRLAKTPLDLLGWLDGVDSLHVCDACNVFEKTGMVHQFCWMSGKLSVGVGHSEIRTPRPESVEISPTFRNRSSHDFGLPQALQLAEITSVLPRRVTVWAIEAEHFTPGDAMSESAHQGVRRAVGMLTEVLRLEARWTAIRNNEEPQNRQPSESASSREEHPQRQAAAENEDRHA